MEKWLSCFDKDRFMEWGHLFSKMRIFSQTIILEKFFATKEFLFISSQFAKNCSIITHTVYTFTILASEHCTGKCIPISLMSINWPNWMVHLADKLHYRQPIKSLIYILQPAAHVSTGFPSIIYPHTHTNCQPYWISISNQVKIVNFSINFTLSFHIFLFTIY